MTPGEHVIIVGGEQDALEARMQGLYLRDTVLLFVPGPSILKAFLFRVPIQETMIESLLRHGAGGLDIDGCRINPGLVVPGCGNGQAHNVKYGSGYTKGTRPLVKPHTAGRWPSNLLLVHGSGCTMVGERKIPGHKGYPNGPGGFHSKEYQQNSPITKKWNNYSSKEADMPWEEYADSEGLETIADWQCQPNCPVGLLDGQSGESKSSGGPIHQSGSSWKCAHQTGVFDRICDSGGASRFYPQFVNPQAALDWLSRLIGADPCPGG